jgi:hypothetical protein
MIDRTNTPCILCETGRYTETSMQDDWHGFLHCNGCGHEIKRWLEEPQDKAATYQPVPKQGKVNVKDYVLQDIQARVDMGLKKHGTYLQTFNGRDPLWDAYQEAIDLVMYLRQAILEKEEFNYSEPE